MSEAVVGAFRAAGDWFLEIAERDDVTSNWQEKSVLSGYTIGGLVGHVGAAVAWLGPLLDSALGDDAPVWGAADYLAPFPVRSADDLDGPLHSAARAQGERSAGRGPADTVARLRRALDGLGPRLEAEDPARLVDLRPTLPAAIPLGAFLRTRVLELVVHGDDLAASIGVDLTPPQPAGAVTVATLVDVAIHQHGVVEVIRALARRERAASEVFPVL